MHIRSVTKAPKRAQSDDCYKMIWFIRVDNVDCSKPLAMD
jgi:hypothetical protein